MIRIASVMIIGVFSLTTHDVVAAPCLTESESARTSRMMQYGLSKEDIEFARFKGPKTYECTLSSPGRESFKIKLHLDETSFILEDIYGKEFLTGRHDPDDDAIYFSNSPDKPLCYSRFVTLGNGPFSEAIGSDNSDLRGAEEIKFNLIDSDGATVYTSCLWLPN